MLAPALNPALAEAEIPALLLQHHEIPRVAGYDESRQSVARHDARAVTSATLD